MNKDSIIIGKKEFRRINDNYYISSKGEVYSKFSKRILKCQIQNKNNKPYMRIDFYIDGKQRHMLIHRLVFETWVRPLKDGEQVNHIDDDSLNNDYRNLYVGTQKENIQDCFNNQHRVGNVFYLTIFDKEKNIIKTFCPANKFIEYCGHSNRSGSLNKYFNKNWFKKRYEIIEFKRINDLNEYKSVTTMGDECNPVE